MPQGRHFRAGSNTMQQVHGAGVKSNLKFYGSISQAFWHFKINTTRLHSEAVVISSHLIDTTTASLRFNIQFFSSFSDPFIRSYFLCFLCFFPFLYLLSFSRNTLLNFLCFAISIAAFFMVFLLRDFFQSASRFLLLPRDSSPLHFYPLFRLPAGIRILHLFYTCSLQTLHKCFTKVLLHFILFSFVYQQFIFCNSNPSPSLVHFRYSYPL